MIRKEKNGIPKSDSCRQMKEIETEVVVVGAGAAGLSAALSAVQNGAQVIVLEKMPFLGGYSLFAEGMFAVESKIQNRDYIGITKEEAFKAHMQNSHWSANGRLVKNVIDKSASTIDWLVNLGLNFSKACALWPNGPRTWHIIDGGGKALIQVLSERLIEKGVKILTETSAQKLIFNKGKQISGIIAMTKDNQEIVINAKVIIIAGGSYANNNKFVHIKNSFNFSVPAIIEMQQTGDHLTMAWEGGAANDGMGVFLPIPAVHGEPPNSQLWAAAFQPFLWVNQQGERFCDESISFYFPIAANALAEQKDGVMYTIFDETSKAKLIHEGIEVSLGVYVPVSTKLEKLDEDIERGTREGKCFVADSLDELAKKIGADPGIIKNTVNEYNHFFEDHQDKYFAKDIKYINPIKTEKLYAIKSSYHIFATFGGIKINHRTETLDDNMNKIPGLYAIGNCAGGMYVWNYDIFNPGSALGFAVNSGRIAAENSLQYIGKR
jgi:fumarate reductase flavoprotein subunit